MRLCVPIPCFFKNVDCCDAIKTVKELGFDAIESLRVAKEIYG